MSDDLYKLTGKEKLDINSLIHVHSVLKEESSQYLVSLVKKALRRIEYLELEARESASESEANSLDEVYWHYTLEPSGSSYLFGPYPMYGEDGESNFTYLPNIGEQVRVANVDYKVENIVFEYPRFSGTSTKVHIYLSRPL